MFAMVGQRRISRERLAEIWRAIEGISLDTDREVSIEEAEAFVEGDTFGEFLDRNSATVQMYEEDHV